MKNATLYKLQKRSALVFAVFLTLHLSNAAALLGGPAFFDRFQRVAHAIYGHWIIEFVLLGAIVAHAAAALVLWKRRPVTAKRPPEAQLQTLAGFALLLFIPGHLYFTRLAAQWFEYVPDHLYLAVTASIWPTLLIPYYMVFGVAGSYHLLHGLKRFLRPGKLRWPLMAVYGAASLVLIASAVAVLAYKPLREPTDSELVKYLSPFAVATPWLIDMADENPYVVRYQALKKAGR
jgi:hypothetical protein